MSKMKRPGFFGNIVFGYSYMFKNMDEYGPLFLKTLVLLFIINGICFAASYMIDPAAVQQFLLEPFLGASIGANANKDQVLQALNMWVFVPLVPDIILSLFATAPLYVSIIRRQVLKGRIDSAFISRLFKAPQTTFIWALIKVSIVATVLIILFAIPAIIIGTFVGMLTAALGPQPMGALLHSLSEGQYQDLLDPSMQTQLWGLIGLVLGGFLLALCTVIPLIGKIEWALPMSAIGEGSGIRRAFKAAKGLGIYTFFQLLFVSVPFMLISALFDKLIVLLMQAGMMPNYAVFALLIIVSIIIEMLTVVALSAAFGNLVRVVFKGK